MHPMMPLVMLIAFSKKDKKKANKTIQSVLPALLPASTMQRAVLATVLAEKEIRRERANEESIVQESCNILQDKSAKIDDTYLKSYPNLASVLTRRPDLKAAIITKNNT